MSTSLVLAKNRVESLFSDLTLRKRLTQVMSYGLTGGWFSPQLPLQVTHQETAGRALDYLPGYNLAIKPRRDSGIAFEQLRNFAQFYDLLRLVIETRKDQISAFDWSIVPIDEDADEATTPEIQAHIDEVTEFLRKPDGRVTWHGWLRSVLEDTFVLDSNVFWPVYKGTKLAKLELVDPVTIKKVIDDSGRTPEPPFEAYQQILKGVPASKYTKDELLYYQRNTRTGYIYGFGPVEQILMTVNIGLRREVSQLQYFTEGNIPEAVAGVPDSWTPENIKQFQTAWDALLSGDTGARRHLKFIPGDAAKILMLKGAEALLKSEFDEWLIRIVCYAFSVSPQAFVKQMNRATAQTANEEARQEGLFPMLDYLKDMMDDIIHRAIGYDDIQFLWNTEQDEDPATQSEIDDRYIKNGVWAIDEVRERQGLEPVGAPNMIFTPKGPVPVSMFTDGSAIDLLFQQGGSSNEEQPTEDGKPPDKGKKSGVSAKNGSGAANEDDEEGDGKEAGSKSAQKFRKALSTRRVRYSLTKTYRPSRVATRKVDPRGAPEGGA